MNKHQIIKWFFVAFVLLYLLVFLNSFQSTFFWLGLAASFLLYGFVVFCGAYCIQLNYFVTAHNKAIEKSPQLSITFDDGPHENTPQILELLKKYQVKATFFIIGKNVLGREKIVQQIIDDGHLIGNHSYAHNTMYSMKSASAMREDIMQNSALLSSIIGKQLKWFRPPYGVTNPKVVKALRTLDMDVIGWNVRSLDTTITDEKKVLQRIVSRLQGGDIVLLHDTIPKTAQVLEALLLHCKEQKIAIVPLDALLNRKAYA